MKEEPEKEDLSDDQGSKYLGFFSSRFLKTREKCISFAQFVSSHKLSKTNIFFSRFEGTRGEKPNISHPREQ